MLVGQRHAELAAALRTHEWTHEWIHAVIHVVHILDPADEAESELIQ